MKRLLLLTLLTALTVGLVIGCGQKADDTSSDKVPPEVKGAEMLDSTRLDSAETGGGAYDSVFQDSGVMNEQ